MEAYHQVVASLPLWLRPPLLKIPSQTAACVHEIRLRSGGAIVLVVNGSPTVTVENLILTQSQIEEILFVLCGGSLYAHETEIAQGYVLLPGGHRVGIGGKYVQDQTGNVVLQKVTSLNLRIARFQAGSLEPVLQNIVASPFSTLLIGGEPGSGKTTALRNIVTYFSQNKELCTVIDERGEIFPYGMYGQTGCDCIQGLNKITAIEMALRTLGPRVLLVDELVSMQETQLLEMGAHTGVNLIITMHASTLLELEQKQQVQYLLAHKILRYACILMGRASPGAVREVKQYW